MRNHFLTSLFLAVAGLALLSACSEKRGNSSAAQTRRVDPRIGRLLALYKQLRFDTLFVFPAADLPGAADYKFRGKAFDSTLISLLPADIAERSVDGVFGCYRFAIDSMHEALVTRVPSYYDPRAIRLLVLDRQTGTLTGNHDLADAFGDAGDFWEKYSWLYRNENGSFESVMWMPANYDHSVEDENDTTVERSDDYFLVRHKVTGADTVSRDAAALKKRFAKLLSTAPHPWPQVRFRQ